MVRGFKGLVDLITKFSNLGRHIFGAFRVEADIIMQRHEVFTLSAFH